MAIEVAAGTDLSQAVSLATSMNVAMHIAQGSFYVTLNDLLELAGASISLESVPEVALTMAAVRVGS